MFSLGKVSANLDTMIRSNKTIKQLKISNFILHETITFDRDPPWINSQVKYLNNENRYCVQNISQK